MSKFDGASLLWTSMWIKVDIMIKEQDARMHKDKPKYCNLLILFMKNALQTNEYITIVTHCCPLLYHAAQVCT